MMGRKGSQYDEQEPLAEALFSPIGDDGHEQITLQWTKGEQQPPQCRDAWAAILFYGQLISIGVLAMLWGVAAVQKAITTTGGSENETDSSSDIDSMGLLYGELVK
jgi:hypothetical protein